MNITDKIEQLKKEKNAIILAHNYQIPEIQDIADFIGDSLGLSQKAATTDADLIVFCGVHFMAETASVIAPDKKVIIPVENAGCSLAESITVEQLIDWKKQHPDALVVSYVNTTADIKALTDYCVTSSNAVKVVQSLPADKEILFLPDKFLGRYVEYKTGRKMFIWDGFCHVHEKIGDFGLAEIQKQHPDAEILIHPECGCSSSCMMKSEMYEDCKNMKIFSTEGMLDHINKTNAKEFIIATEVGIIHRLKKHHPDREFYPVSDKSVCEYMKMINLENLYEALRDEKYIVKVPEELAVKARIPIQRMLEIV